MPTKFIPAEIRSRRPGSIDRATVAENGQERLALQTSGAVVELAAFDDSAMSERGIWSTDSEDRVGDIVVSPGCILEEFERSPSIFLNHQDPFFPLPFAQARRGPGYPCTAKIEPHRVTGVIYYSQTLPEGQQFYLLSKEGILSSYSIGFNPASEPIRLPTGGFRYTSWTLLEVSKVGVACNSQATTLAEPAAEKLRSMLARGRIAGEPISERVQKALSPLAQRPKVQVGFTSTPAERVNTLLKALPDQLAKKLAKTLAQAVASKTPEASADELAAHAKHLQTLRAAADESLSVQADAACRTLKALPDKLTNAVAKIIRSRAT